MHASEVGEGVMIATLGSLHKGSLVHDPPMTVRRGDLVALGY
jgi:hypothetical protein